MLFWVNSVAGIVGVFFFSAKSSQLQRISGNQTEFTFFLSFSGLGSFIAGLVAGVGNSLLRTLVRLSEFRMTK